MEPNNLYNSYDKNLYATGTVVSTSAISMLQAGTSQMANTIMSADNIDSGVSTGNTPQATGAASRQGKTKFDNTVAGYILGFDPSDGNAKFYIGSTTSYLNWDGSSLIIVGNITATTGTIGGFVIGATTISGGSSLVLDSTGTGTITGGTIRTSATGQRVILDGANNILTFYDNVGQVISIGSSIALNISGTSSTNNGVVMSSSVAGVGFEYDNTGNVVSYGLKVNLSGATNTGIGVNIINAGTTTAYGLNMTVSNASFGMLITNSGSGNSIDVQHTGSGIGMNINVNHSGGNPTAIKIATANGVGNSYAFEFAGSEVISAAVGGTQNRKIRILLPSGAVYYIPCYDA